MGHCCFRIMEGCANRSGGWGGGRRCSREASYLASDQQAACLLGQQGDLSLRPAHLPCCQRSRPVDLPPAIGEERPPLGLQHGCCGQRWRNVGKPGRSTPPFPRSWVGTSARLLASRSTFLASHPPEGVPQVVSLAERGEGALFLGSLNTQSQGQH